MDQLLNTQELYIFLDVVIAGVLAMLVGLEREKADKAAGMRTNMIVSSFTCLVVSLVNPLADYVKTSENIIINTDPIRIIQSVVIGISFIGAGTIIKGRHSKKVTGLTTAATLLYSIGIGVCVAIHSYLLAVLLTLFILIINYVVSYITRKFTSIKD